MKRSLTDNERTFIEKMVNAYERGEISTCVELRSQFEREHGFERTVDVMAYVHERC